MTIALRTELTKLLRAAVVRATSVAVVLGISLICVCMLLSAGTDDPQLAAKLGPLVDPGGWVGYLTAAAQVTGAAGLLGYGVVLSWLFSREFTDGTTTGLFAVPVPRPTIAVAKLVVYAAWAVVCAVALLTALILFGLATGLGSIPSNALPAIGRSVLAGIGMTIGILVVAQVSVIAGAGGWVPFAAPALWAISGGDDVSPLQLSLITPLALAATGCTLLTWHRLQLDR